MHTPEQARVQQAAAGLVGRQGDVAQPEQLIAPANGNVTCQDICGRKIEFACEGGGSTSTGKTTDGRSDGAKLPDAAIVGIPEDACLADDVELERVAATCQRPVGADLAAIQMVIVVVATLGDGVVEDVRCIVFQFNPAESDQERESIPFLTPPIDFGAVQLRERVPDEQRVARPGEPRADKRAGRPESYVRRFVAVKVAGLDNIAIAQTTANRNIGAAFPIIIKIGTARKRYAGEGIVANNGAASRVTMHNRGSRRDVPTRRATGHVLQTGIAAAAGILIGWFICRHIVDHRFVGAG